MLQESFQSFNRINEGHYHSDESCAKGCKKSIGWLEEHRTQPSELLKQVIFCKRRKKPIAICAGSSYATSSGASGQLKESALCKKKQLSTPAAATTFPRQSHATTTSLFESQTFTLASALRQITLSLLPLQVTAAETATEITNTNLVTGTGSNSDNGSNSHLSSVLPLSLCHFLRLTFTFCQWTIAFTTLILFIICLNNLIASVSALQHNAIPSSVKSEPSPQQFVELNYYHHNHHLSSPVARLRSSSSAITTQRNQQATLSSSNVSGVKTAGCKHHHSSSPSSSSLSGVKDDNQNGDYGNNFDRRHRSMTATHRKQLPPLNHETNYTQSVSTKSPMETTTVSVREQKQTPSLPELSFRQLSATMVSAENQWIPIVSATAGNQHTGKPPLILNGHHQTVENALLDYPSLYSPPLTDPTHNVIGRLNMPSSSPSPSLLDHQQINYIRPQPTNLQPPQPRLLAKSARELMQPTASLHHYQHHRPHRHYPSHRHHHHNPRHYQHRRPRLNNNYPPLTDSEIMVMGAGKMYTRVLLCDKTLVSLDYVRNLNSEPRPFGHSLPTTYKGPFVPHSPSSTPPSSSDGLIEEVLNDIGDNLIDLDSHYSTLSNSQAEASNSSNPQSIAAESGSTGRHQQSGNQLSLGSSDFYAFNITISASDSNSSDAFAPLERLSASASILEQRSGSGGGHLLNDDDPLVRCDMWDLEKGLKSRKPPEHLLRVAIKADFDTVRDAINRCRQLSEKTLPSEDEYRDGLEIMSTEDLISLFSMKRGLIPGTKWCGLGDQASSYNDLGPKHRIDICCRAHDHCPIRSKPFRNDYGVLNIGLYTKSHCDCDADFYRCLREVRSRTADMLGNLYFNVMKLQCMREERLKVCREMKPIALGFERCVRYEESPVKTVFKFTTPPIAY